jgi:hypothetical protein
MDRDSFSRLLLKGIIALSLFLPFTLSGASAAEPMPSDCKPLDTTEFGLISDGGISEPWSEVELLQKYGPPCYVLPLGEVFIRRNYGRVFELGPVIGRHDRTVAGEIAIKKQYVYTGDYTNGTSIITIVGGVVVKKERIY